MITVVPSLGDIFRMIEVSTNVNRDHQCRRPIASPSSHRRSKVLAGSRHDEIKTFHALDTRTLVSRAAAQSANRDGSEVLHVRWKSTSNKGDEIDNDGL